MRLSRKLRKRHYYKVPEAGAQVAFSRAESYRAAERGDIPTERDGKFLLVPRKPWDRIKKQIFSGSLPKTRHAAVPTTENAETNS